MKNNGSYCGSLGTKVLLTLKILYNTPKILFRCITLLIKRKRLKLHYFKTDAQYCIHGTLNQLMWKVENSVFIILDNSSKLSFGSNEQIFKVDHGKTQFNLTCYGVGNKIRVATSIQVVQLGVNDFNGVALRRDNRITGYNKIDFATCKINVTQNPFNPKPENIQLKGINLELNQQLYQLGKMNSNQKIKEFKRTLTNQS